MKKEMSRSTASTRYLNRRGTETFLRKFSSSQHWLRVDPYPRRRCTSLFSPRLTKSLRISELNAEEFECTYRHLPSPDTGALRTSRSKACCQYASSTDQTILANPIFYRPLRRSFVANCWLMKRPLVVLQSTRGRGDFGRAESLISETIFFSMESRILSFRYQLLSPMM